MFQVERLLTLGEDGIGFILRPCYFLNAKGTPQHVCTRITSREK